MSKFFEVQLKVGEKMQNEMAAKQGASGAMGFGT